MAMEHIKDVEQVELGDVRDDPSWATEDSRIEAFRAMLRQGKRFGTPTVRRVWHEDTSFHYEIIDGFHRIRALIAEDYESYPMTVNECDERTADFDRIQASLDKPDPILVARAEVALRQRFLRDMMAVLEGQTFYERALHTDGTVIAVKRQDALPNDPGQALVVLVEHTVARALLSQRSGIKMTMEMWEKRFDRWVAEICEWLHVKPTWLRQAVNAPTFLGLGENQEGALGAEVLAVAFSIPDRELRGLVIAKLRNENWRASARPKDELGSSFKQARWVEEALVWVGASEGRLYSTSERRQRSRQETFSMLSHLSLSAIHAAMEDEKRIEAEALERKQKEVRRRQRDEAEQDAIEPETDKPTNTIPGHQEDPEQSSSIFAYASPGFVGQSGQQRKPDHMNPAADWRALTIQAGEYFLGRLAALQETNEGKVPPEVVDLCVRIAEAVRPYIL